MQIIINPDAQTPIYQQIVDAVYEDIRSGRLAAGEKLPTVRDLADEMKLARGTIKRAYDELEKLGAIQMTQGRGTFVLAHEEEPDSHKERAMRAIDALLDELEALSFTPNEIKIFFDLKLRARIERGSNVQVAVVDCNPEALSLIVNQLYNIEGVEVYRFLLDDVAGAPYRLGDNVDLIITTSSHFSELEKLVADHSRIAKVVLMPTQNTVLELAKVRDGDRLGIMSVSEKFASVIQNGCNTLIGREHAMEVRLFGQPTAGLTDFLENKDVLLIPPNYLRFCTAREGEAVRAFGRRGVVIQYEYKIDAGSFMYLRDLIESARRRKGAR